MAADLSATSGTVTFAANSAAGATQTISITATDDSLSETSESFTVTLGAITTTLPSAQVTLKSDSKTATATIAESDSITISISGPTEEVTEGDAATYTVSLSGGTPTSNLTVKYDTEDGKAIAGSDYTAKSATLTFTQADAEDKTFSVQTTEDILAENTEDFTVTISNPTGGGGPSPSLGTDSVSTSIRDNDAVILSPSIDPESNAAITIRLTVNPDSVNEGDGETTFTVTATRSSGVLDEATVVGLVLGGTAGSSDYTGPTEASVTIPAGQSSGSGTLTLTMIDDDISEGDETIFVGGDYESLGMTSSDIASALITIIDNDSAYLSIIGPTANVTEGSNASFTVTLSKTVTADVTVAWSATAVTASASDFSSTSSGTVTFTANSAANATQTITIATINDMLSEGEETFSVALGEDTGDEADKVWVKSTAASAEATIAESDPITVSISGPSSVDEGDVTTAYTVSLSPSGVTPTEDLTVNYATSNGTAIAGSDYTSASGTLTFSSGSTADKTFTVQTTEDNIDEPNEDFAVSISSPSGGGGSAPSLGTSSSTTTTITDDDNAPTGIALSASPSTLGEDDNATSITVTATLQGGTTRNSPTVVTIQTLSGSATKDTDYSATTLANITIPAGAASASQSFTVTPIDDSIVEGDETITIPGTTTVSGLNITSATVTLTDDNKSTTTPNDKDSAELSITGPTASVNEGNNAVFTVILSHAVSKEVSVTWSAPLTTDDAMATDLDDTSSTITFSANSAAGANESITIAVTDDALSETAESFTVTLGAITSTLSSQISKKTGENSDTATIAESDPITVSISGPSSVDEGDTTGNYTVSITGGTPTADISVSYATSNGTAIAGSDYTAASDTLTFSSGSTADKTFTIQTTEDNLDESDETFTVTLSNATGGGGTTTLGTAKSVTTTITDDDDAPSDISLSVTPNTLGEDDDATDFTITATLNGGTTRTEATVVTITLGGTATSSDYEVTTALASITIPEGESSEVGTVTLTPTNDSIVEGDETIDIDGSTTVGLDVSPAQITLTDDSQSERVDSADAIHYRTRQALWRKGTDAVFTVTLSS